MSDSQALTFDVNETFPRLQRSPLIEGVIHFQAHASQPLERDEVKNVLKKELPDYPDIHTQYQNLYGLRIAPPEQSDNTPDVIKETAWEGYRLANAAGNRVVQFTQNGIVVSSIKNYESWDFLQPEALRIWRIFQDTALPQSINRLGVRFINKVVFEAGEDASTYLKSVPHNHFDLPIIRESFFYQDAFKIPETPYGVNWVCTQQSDDYQGFLIVDIDVFIENIDDLDPANLIIHLSKIRWLKNKIFYNSITDQALTKFGG